MNKLTKVLLILPLITVSTIGCGKAEPRIETITDGPMELTVNCTDKLIYNVSEQEWFSRSESTKDVTPGYEQMALTFFDGIITQACGN